MHRLFIGLRPPAPIRAHLLGVMGGVPGARWQSDAQLHLTVRYVGEVDRPLAEDIALALAHVRFPVIEASIAGTGQFESRGRPNAIWAGVRPHDALAQLHRKLDQAMVRLGQEPERRAYLPHITLARLNGPANIADAYLAGHAGLSSPPFVFTHLTLFESHLTGEGAIYEPIERYALG
ncbi:MAG: RNA 2',3'-cyclic phosphodiesterase [Pseudomonadota bacterium]